MSKKVLIISSSPRNGGNSDMLCDKFLQGATESGNSAEKIRLADYKINYCQGCEFCVKNNHTGCSQRDDMAGLMERFRAADVIVMATPIYFYTMCGQLKTFIDRCCMGYTGVGAKDFYFIMTAADGDKECMDRTIEEFRGFTYCLDGAKERGLIRGLGAWAKGDIANSKAINEAYAMGKAIK